MICNAWITFFAYIILAWKEANKLAFCNTMMVAYWGILYKKYILGVALQKLDTDFLGFIS